MTKKQFYYSGKGLEGRKDMDKNTGYVGNYKGDGTYDKTH